MGGGAEGTGGEVQGAFQRHVVGQVRAPLLRRRPVRPKTAHVLPEGLGRLEGRERTALGDLARPVFSLAHLGRAPVAPRIRSQILRIHLIQYIAALNRQHAYRVRKPFTLHQTGATPVWQYVHRERIPVVPLYFAKERPVVERNGALSTIALPLTTIPDSLRYKCMKLQDYKKEGVRWRPSKSA